MATPFGQAPGVRAGLAAVATFSLAINLLYLATPIYMLQVYDRIVPSGSVSTLLLLTLIVVVALAALSGLDAVRSIIMSRISVRYDQVVAGRVLASAFQSAGGIGGSRSLRDVETLRQFTTSAVLLALFDLPFVPIYVLAAFLLHPMLGVFTAGCCVLLFGLALLNEWRLVRPLRQAREAGVKAGSFAEMAARNVEVVLAMGMLDGVLRRWGRDRVVQRKTQTAATELSIGSTSLAKFFRLVMQSLILGIGAYLAILREVNVGAIFAGTFLLGRTLQPLEQIIAGWRQAVAARVAHLNIRKLLAEHQAAPMNMSLPRPNGHVAVENLHFAMPQSTKLILRAVSFRLQAGEALGVVGPSGAGKSSLARLLVGIQKPTAGLVRLDGADLQTLPRAELGSCLGYLPQDVELFSDTVAANISRFQPGMEREVVVAAELAGVHEMILRLPQGYNTEIGEGGALLSGGYRQRIGLARAVFGGPSLVVLDEPSSNLDVDGDMALARCMTRLKEAGCSVVVISHRPTTLAAVDHILVLKDGTVEAFGPRHEIAAKLTTPREPAPAVSRQGVTVDG